MLWGEKGTWAARNLFKKILNGPPGRQTDRQTDRDRQGGRVNSKIECGSTFVRLALKSLCRN